MTGDLLPQASRVPAWLECASQQPPESNIGAWLDHLIRERDVFGITRVGSITRLDRIGIPVVQVSRPLALSNAVSQGKGLNWVDATASALMEAIETWASERVAEEVRHRPPVAIMQPFVHDLYKPWIVTDATGEWDPPALMWCEGWDLMSNRVLPVPSALVDTAYTWPSPYRPMFWRTTTGLAAGRNLAQAVIHAGLEVLERDAIFHARQDVRFFDRHQVSSADIAISDSLDLFARIEKAGLLYGIWRAPTAHGLPIYWCHLMERGPPDELVPLPSEGFGCDFTESGALLKAVLEACQARCAAIAGAREDITRDHYPGAYDRAHLAEWREQLTAPRQIRVFPRTEASPPVNQGDKIAVLLRALRLAGAKAAVVVPVLFDEDRELHVARLICPPLHPDPRAFLS